MNVPVCSVKCIAMLNTLLARYIPRLNTTVRYKYGVICSVLNSIVTAGSHNRCLSELYSTSKVADAALLEQRCGIGITLDLHSTSRPPIKSDERRSDDQNTSKESSNHHGIHRTFQFPDTLLKTVCRSCTYGTGLGILCGLLLIRVLRGIFPPRFLALGCFVLQTLHVSVRGQQRPCMHQFGCCLSPRWCGRYLVKRLSNFYFSL